MRVDFQPLEMCLLSIDGTVVVTCQAVWSKTLWKLFFEGWGLTPEIWRKKKQLGFLKQEDARALCRGVEDGKRPYAGDVHAES